MKSLISASFLIVLLVAQKNKAVLIKRQREKEHVYCALMSAPFSTRELKLCYASRFTKNNQKRKCEG